MTLYTHVQVCPDYPANISCNGPIGQNQGPGFMPVADLNANSFVLAQWGGTGACASPTQQGYVAVSLLPVDACLQMEDANGLNGAFVPASSVQFGAPNGFTPPFDVSALDPASITAYFCWGWFIVAMGWAIGKGVAMFVQFVKQL